MRKTKLSVVAILLSTVTLACTAQSVDKAEMDGFYLAMNSMNPAGAYYTQKYHQMIELQCNNALSVTDLTSEGFTNVVTAFESAEMMEKKAIHDEYKGLTNTIVQLAKDTISCADYGAPFKLYLSNKSIEEKYPQFMTLIQIMNDATLNYNSKS